MSNSKKYGEECFIDRLFICFPGSNLFGTITWGFGSYSSNGKARSRQRLPTVVGSPSHQMQDSSDELWAQTSITVTPQEDGTIREIKSDLNISGRSGSELKLNPDDVLWRKTILDVPKSFITREELETQNLIEAECQTYLQGTSKVQLPLNFKDETTQTVFIGRHCPPLQTVKDVIDSTTEKPMPEMKTSVITQTIITFFPHIPHEEATRELLEDITEDLEDSELVVKATEEEELESLILDILNYLLYRAIWVSDPERISSYQMKDVSVETLVKFHYGANKLMSDNDTQTNLTCRPRDSNTKLLSSYQETKNLALLCLEECLDKGVGVCIIIDDIIDEIVNRCCERIRFPPKEQFAQTLATCRDGKDEVVLRKLRRGFVVDPFEATIVVIPILEDILKSVCVRVGENAAAAVKTILCILVRRSVVISTKMAAIRKEVEPRPMEDVFKERRRKIEASMQRKQTDTASTQTGLAGVPDLVKIREPRETLCTVCARESECKWCLGCEEGSDLPREDVQILRTQDILLPYRPCYVVTTKDEAERDPDLVPVCQPKVEKEKKELFCECRDPDIKPDIPLDVVFQTVQRKTPRKADSVRSWSHVVEDPFNTLWSVRGSMSTVSSLSSTRSSKLSSHKKSRNFATKETFDILRTAFCTAKTCQTFGTESERETAKEDCMKPRGQESCLSERTKVSTKESSGSNENCCTKPLSRQQEIEKLCLKKSSYVVNNLFEFQRRENCRSDVTASTTDRCRYSLKSDVDNDRRGYGIDAYFTSSDSDS